MTSPSNFKITHNSTEFCLNPDELQTIKENLLQLNNSSNV